MGRALILSDPKVVNLISTRFVPCAVRTGWYLAPEESKFLKQIEHPGGTFRMYACTAGGKGLPVSGSNLAALETVLGKFKPEANPKVPALSEKSQDSVVEPPPGTEVLYVVWNVLDGLKLLPLEKHPAYGKLQREPGFDRLWIRKDEAQALTKGEFPESLKKRMFTKVNQIFFVPETKKLAVTLDKGRLSGVVHAETKSGKGGYQMDFLGFVETKAGKLTRFDMVAKGAWRNDQVSAYASNLAWASNKGQKVTVAVSFTLADPNDVLAKTPPSALNVPQAMAGYLNP
jgi:hypothetical protein